MVRVSLLPFGHLSVAFVEAIVVKAIVATATTAAATAAEPVVLRRRCRSRASMVLFLCRPLLNRARLRNTQIIT